MTTNQNASEGKPFQARAEKEGGALSRWYPVQLDYMTQRVVVMDFNSDEASNTVLADVSNMTREDRVKFVSALADFLNAEKIQPRRWDIYNQETEEYITFFVIVRGALRKGYEKHLAVSYLNIKEEGQSHYD